MSARTQLPQRIKVVPATDTFANAVIAVLYNGKDFPVSTEYATEIVQL